MEKTFIMVKPDGVRRKIIWEVLKRIEMKGLTIGKMLLTQPTRTKVEEHYQEHNKKNFYNELVEFITSGKIVLLEVEGENAIKIMRNLVGDTDPTRALPGTIRGDFANSKTKNIVHASDSRDSAIRELNLWFKEDKCNE